MANAASITAVAELENIKQEVGHVGWLIGWLVVWLNMADLSREWCVVFVAWDQLIQTVHSHSSYSRKRKDTHCAQQLDVVAVVYIIMAKAMKNSHNNGTV